MKKILFAALLLFSIAGSKAQKTKQMDLQQINDRAAIKEVLDQFSLLADTKDVATQVLLFTDDGTVENYNNGKLGGVLKGRKQIGDAFSAYLANFSTVYHMNGQQVVKLDGDKASTVSYCLVKLVGKINGQDVNMTHHIIYSDDFVKQNGKWSIKKRKADFVYTETK